MGNIFVDLFGQFLQFIYVIDYIIPKAFFFQRFFYSMNAIEFEVFKVLYFLGEFPAVSDRVEGDFNFIPLTADPTLVSIGPVVAFLGVVVA